jgi:hypothetical protein
VPPYIWYVLILLGISRVALTGIGMMSRWTMLELTTARPSDLSGGYSDKLWLDVWAVWDSGWYLDIAQRGYSADSISPLVAKTALPGQYNYAFFPLYPMLMRAAAFVLGGNVCLGGFVVSNAAFFVSGVLLYKLVLMDSDALTARRAIRYLIAFPTAFLFSAVLTEGVFLMLALACFYAARKRAWMWAGAMGLLLSLTRNTGVLALVPLLYEYLESRQFRVRRIRASILWLALLPAGLGMFMAYNHHLTGDWLAFLHVQKAWDRTLANPFTLVWRGLMTPVMVVRLPVVFVLALLALTVVFCRRVPVSFTLLSLLWLLLPMSGFGNDLPLTGTLARYVTVVFPAYVLLAKITRNTTVDTILMTVFLLLQGFLVGFWTCGSMLVF